MDKLKSDLGKTKTAVVEATDKIKKSFAGATESVKEMGSEIRALKRTIAGVGIFALVRGVQSLTAAFFEQEQAEAQLAARIKLTGGAAGLSAAELKLMATELQNVTTVSNMAVIGAQGVLLTFTKIGRQIFPQALEAALDLSMALGTDLNSAVLQVGKALNDPIAGVMALTRAGVQFTTAQKDQIATFVETNNLLGAQRIILAELSNQMGGAARAAAETYAGRISQLNNTMGDFRRLGGGIAIMLLDQLINLKQVVQWYGDLADILGNNTAKVKEHAAAVAAAAKEYALARVEIDQLMKAAEADIIPGGGWALVGSVATAQRIADLTKRMEELRKQFPEITRGLRKLNEELEEPMPGRPAVSMGGRQDRPEAPLWQLTGPRADLPLAPFRGAQRRITAQNLRSFQREESERILALSQMQLDALNNLVEASLIQPMTGFFESLASGTRNLRDAWRKMLQEMGAALARFLAGEAVKAFLRLLFTSIGLPFVPAIKASPLLQGGAGGDASGGILLGMRGGGGFTPRFDIAIDGAQVASTVRRRLEMESRTGLAFA